MDEKATTHEPQASKHRFERVVLKISGESFTKPGLSGIDPEELSVISQEIADAASSEGIAIDPAGHRLDQIQRVFSNLVAIAHRQQLPWEVHLLRHPMPNAMTPGGGMVFVFEGIFTDYPAKK